MVESANQIKQEAQQLGLPPKPEIDKSGRIKLYIAFAIVYLIIGYMIYVYGWPIIKEIFKKQ